MTYSFVAKSANYQTPDETQAVLTYQLSKVFDCLYGRESETGFRSFASTEFADMTAMCRMLCEQEKYDFEKLCFNPEPREWSVDTILAKLFIALGKVVQRRHYIKRFGVSRHGKPEDAMHELTQLMRHLCYHMNWDFWELCDMGESRYEERMKDLRENGLNQFLKPEYQRQNN